MPIRYLQRRFSVFPAAPINLPHYFVRFVEVKTLCCLPACPRHTIVFKTYVGIKAGSKKRGSGRGKIYGKSNNEKEKEQHTEEVAAIENMLDCAHMRNRKYALDMLKLFLAACPDISEKKL